MSVSDFPDRAAYLRHMAGGRDLAVESRGGVPHFKTGQHHAKLYPPAVGFFNEPIQVGRLTYVDVMGHLCVVLVARASEDDPWRATWASRHGQTIDERARQLAPGELQLSATMLAALAAADRVETGEQP